MSLSPNSSLVRRTIDLNYANKQRSDSIKWIFINGALFMIFTYDLCGACAGYSSALHYAEALCAGALGAAALWHATRLLPRRSPPVELTRTQQRLLGLRDDDLDSSFHITPDSGSEGRVTPARDLDDDCVSLSPARSWRGEAGGGVRRSAGSAPPSPQDSPPDRAGRDEFIADHTELNHYLRERERHESALSGWSGGAVPWAQFGGGAGRAPHQLAPLPAAPYAAPAAADGVSAAPLWRRMHVDPQHLTQFNLNLRRWIHATILERLVREIDECDAELAASGHEARIGSAAAARLEALAAAGAAGAAGRRLRELLPYLRPYADQKYLVARVRELARGGCLAAYRWDGGGAGWQAAGAQPADAELVLHLLAAYLDGVVPGGAGSFSGAHVSSAPAPPPRGPGALALHRVSQRPPHYVVALGEELVEVSRGRHNLLHSLLLFVAACARAEPPVLRRLHLGPAGLNMLWILGR